MGFESTPAQPEPPKTAAERDEDEQAKTPAPGRDGEPEEGPHLRHSEYDPLPSFRDALAEIRKGRDPHQEIDTETESTRIAHELERVLETLTKRPTGTQEGTPDSPAKKEGMVQRPETLPELKEVRKEFENEQKKIELAEHYNDVLESLAHYDDDELQSVLETGRTRDGRTVRDKRAKELAPEVAKHLADLAKHGMRRLTWGSFNRMLQLFDALLKDLFAPLKELKRLVGLRG